MVLFTGGHAAAASLSNLPVPHRSLQRLVDYSDSEGEDEGSNQFTPPPPPPNQSQDPDEPPAENNLPLPISDYFTLSSPMNTFVKAHGIHGKAYHLSFKNFDQMTDLETILCGIFRRVQTILNSYLL